MNALAVVENFLGEALTPQLGHSFAQAPLEHLLSLIEKLAPVYYDWLETEERQRSGEGPEIYHTVDPYRKELVLTEKLERYKGLLLYFPRIALPDPMAEAIWPVCTMSALMQGLGEVPLVPFTETTEQKLRRQVAEGLHLMAELRPLLNSGEITLIPAPFPLDYSVVQQGVRDELKALSTRAALQSYGDIDHGLIGAVKAWCRVCAMCDFTPVAGREWVAKVIQEEYRQAQLNFRRVPVTEMRITPILSERVLPGVSRAKLREVISLRRSEAAFAEWRRSFDAVLARICEAAPIDDRQFEVEFRRAVEMELTPRIEALKATVKGSPVLTSILVPAALTLGGGCITYHLTGSPLVASAVSAASIPVNWVADRLVKRFKKAGRNAQVLREFYGYLTERESSRA